MATPSQKSPVKYAGITPPDADKIAPARVPLPPDMVYIVRGRTASKVFHTDPHCPKLCPEAKAYGVRYSPRPVKRAYATAGHQTLCAFCLKPQQRQLQDYAQQEQVPA